MAGTFKVDRTVSEAKASEYDTLVLPGGVANPDFLRTDEQAVGFARDFFEQAKPVGVICHGPWTLVSSRNPGDLPAFCAKLVEEFCEGEHTGQRQSLRSAS